ncbi:MAG TPA: FAD-dependent oxidoreductase [Thermoanaerobaculia bacterium]|nr:FAD-dependent oxidoreductase [Thermoanaerobaculia bacterium]
MELSRRDLLTAFLGAPFAALACRERPLPLPPGELVGASDTIGHRLRGGQAILPVRWESHDVVIAGGGIAGLAAAWRLAAAGVNDVVLFDLEPVVGGTSRSSASYPWGAHYIVAPSPENRVLIRLLDEMGVFESGAGGAAGFSPPTVSGGLKPAAPLVTGVNAPIAEQFLVRDPEERVFYRGRWYEGLYLHAGASNEDLRQLKTFESEIAKWAAFRDGRGRPAFAIPMALGSDDAEVTALDRMSMRDWMDARGFTSPRLRWLVEYATRDDYGALMEHTSAWAAVFYFASREQRPVITWPEGNGRVVAHLARFARPRTSWLVTNLAPTESGVDVIAVRGDEAIGIHARRVIFAGPQFVARHVIPSRETARFAYGSWMVANIAVREHPQSSGFPEAWDNVIYDSPGLGYVVSTHQRGPDRGPTVLTYYYALSGGDPRVERERLLSTGRDGWAEVALADLSRAHPELRTLATKIDVMRWGHAMVRPEPNFVWGEGRRRAAEPFRGIHFANTDLSGIALMEEALYHGVRAAEEVMGGGGTWL